MSPWPADPAESRADLESGEGLADAVRDADVVVHLASDPRKPKRVDVAGTRRLLEFMDTQHLVYMSIVGVDQHPFAYYRAKYEVEQMVEASDVRYTILRATQFHDFVSSFLGAACKPPVALIPKSFVFQPVDTGEVASRLAALVHDPRPGLEADFAGPEVHTAEYLARSLMEARGRERPMLNLPVFGKAARAFKEGRPTPIPRQPPGYAPGRSSSLAAEGSNPALGTLTALDFSPNSRRRLLAQMEGHGSGGDRCPPRHHRWIDRQRCFPNPGGGAGDLVQRDPVGCPRIPPHHRHLHAWNGQAG